MWPSSSTTACRTGISAPRSVTCCVAMARTSAIRSVADAVVMRQLRVWWRSLLIVVRTGFTLRGVGGPQGLGHVRLAELVAALSLGVDLGFDQPMEHVLRQSLIALRLADRVGVDEQARVAVYYTALLTNVGCHSDAHEQAKWFGDDIAMKSTKYDHPFHSLRAALAGLSLIGSGNPPLHRFRVGLEFVTSG